MERAKRVILVVLLSVCNPSQCQQYTLATFNIPGVSSKVDFASIGSSLSEPVLGFVSVTSITYTSDKVLADTCPTGSFAVEASETCTMCAAGKYSSTPVATGPDTCIACEAGSYSNVTGAASKSTCLQCPPNTYFSGIGGASASVCLSCPGNSSSYESSKTIFSCVCNPGYAGPNGENNLLIIIIHAVHPHNDQESRYRRGVPPVRGHGMVQKRSSQQLSPTFNECRASVFPQPMPVQSRVLWRRDFIPHAMPGEFEHFFFHHIPSSINPFYPFQFDTQIPWLPGYQSPPRVWRGSPGVTRGRDFFFPVLQGRPLLSREGGEHIDRLP